MTDLRTAAQQALEALEQLQGGCTDSDDGTVEAITVWCPEVITALRAALEQPEPRNQCGETCERATLCAVCARGLAQQEQEPVAWIDDSGHPKHRLYLQSATEKRLYGPLRPLYAVPPRREWQGLTDEELDLIYAQPQTHKGQYARAIEQALRSKNNG